jgi:predicted  nucleic acid-binding Zn-ribbon protein
MNLDHLRLQLDDLEHRADDARDAADRRQIGLECTALERSIVTVEEELERNIAMLEGIRKRLRRLRARA